MSQVKVAKKLNINVFDVKTINKAVSELEALANSFEDKCYQFCNEMTRLGYATAMANKGMPGRYGTHRMEDYVTFTVNLQREVGGCTGFVIGIDNPFTTFWSSNGQTYSAEIHPLEMIEFGSAKTALTPLTVQKRFPGHVGGRGTMAVMGNQRKTEWGNGNNLTSITPTMPMYNAYLMMMKSANEIARKIFKNG